jgi:hypothetical protein
VVSAANESFRRSPVPSPCPDQTFNRSACALTPTSQAMSAPLHDREGRRVPPEATFVHRAESLPIREICVIRG